MKFTLTLLLVVGIILDAGAVAAQQASQRLSPQAQFVRDDTNQDGRVSRQEFKGAERLFERLDRDQDGFISRAELRPNQAATGNRRRRLPEGIELERDVVYGTGGGRELHLHLLMPMSPRDEAQPAYVWIHGGGWKGGTKEGGIQQVLPLVQRGFVGATIEYRLTGEAPFPAQIEDCKCAIRFLRAHAEEYGIDPKRIAVGGSSAGGHLAALVGTSGGVPGLEGSGGWDGQSSAVQAVVDLYGPTDFARFVATKGYESHDKDGSPESLLLGGGRVSENTAGIRRVNPITYIDQDDPPFLILHGSADPVVPVNQSESLHAALLAKSVPSTLHLLPDARHGGPAFAESNIREMQWDFLTDRLGVKE